MINHFVINGFIADQSAFPSAFVVVITLHWLPKLLANHMDEWLHTIRNMLYQRAVSILSLHKCGGTASSEIGQETETSKSMQNIKVPNKWHWQVSMLQLQKEVVYG